MSDNEWKREATSDNEWQRVVISAIFYFFRIREELNHLENPLNLEQELLS